MPHANVVLLERFFRSLNDHDHEAMANCYHSDATFRDIAFDLNGRIQIHAMWHMICEGDIRATFEVINADDHDGRVAVVDDYTFSSSMRKVHNAIDSHYSFRDGKIIRQSDFCDASAWAAMALGGVTGFLVGRIRFLRSMKAREKLRSFIARHPEYR